jgi:hypothetical protein
MRGSDHDKGIHEYVIRDKGLVVGEHFRVSAGCSPDRESAPSKN